MGGLVFVGGWRLWGRSRGGFSTDGKVVVGYGEVGYEAACLHRHRQTGKGIRYTVYAT